MPAYVRNSVSKAPSPVESESPRAVSADLVMRWITWGAPCKGCHRTTTFVVKRRDIQKLAIICLMCNHIEEEGPRGL